MNPVLNVLQVGVVFLLMITVLVAAHELGHYLFARLFRMGIHEFAIGFGRPKLWTWKRKKSKLDDGTELETEFNLRAWPLGGFVRIVGMEPQEDGSERQIVNGFYSRPAWQRFIVLLAGPVFSVVSGLIVLTGIYWSQGVPEMTSRVQRLTPGLAAQAAGVKVDDVIVSIAGQPVTNGMDVRRLLAESVPATGLVAPVPVGVTRAGQPLTFNVTPKLSDDLEPMFDSKGQPTGESLRPARIGVEFLSTQVPVSFPGAVGRSIGMTVTSAKGLVAVFTQPKKAKENVGGVVSIVGVTNSTVNQGGLIPTLFLAGMLSISIGFFNLLPVPPLDGGQMLLALVEMVRGGRRPSIRFQNALVSIGSVMLLTLFVGVLVLDISRVIRGRSDQKEKPLTLPAKPAVEQPAPTNVP